MMAVLVLWVILPPASRHIRWVVSAGLAQVSEFSFVLSSRARRAGIISREVGGKCGCEVEHVLLLCGGTYSFLRVSLGSGVPAGPQCHHSQSAAGAGAVEDQHTQMGSHRPTQNHHMTEPSPQKWDVGGEHKYLTFFPSDALFLIQPFCFLSLRVETV